MSIFFLFIDTLVGGGFDINKAYPVYLILFPRKVHYEEPIKLIKILDPSMKSKKKRFTDSHKKMIRY